MPVYTPRTIPVYGGTESRVVEEIVSSYTSTGATTEWADFDTISLTPGDWDLSAVVCFNRNTATSGSTYQQMGISTTSGNDSTGLTEGTNLVSNPAALAAASDTYLSINAYRVQPTVTTTYYLKGRCDYSTGQARYKSRIIGIRRDP